MKENLRRSPFFYVGDKYKLLSKIKPFFPAKIETFVEPFTGGGSVFLNIKAKHYIINDIDKNVIGLHEFLISQAGKEKEFLKKIKTIAGKYSLSHSAFGDVVSRALKKKWVKTYYAEHNRRGYGRLKQDFNKSSKKDLLLLFLLLIYGFNRILRFNRRGEFNIPVGNVDFNKNVLASLKDYFSFAREHKLQLRTLEFEKFIKNLKLKKNDFVYVDPPYLISASEYNKLWSKEKDLRLFETLDSLSASGVKFALSNIIRYNGNTNLPLIEWMRKYVVHPIESNYISYHDNTKKKIEEVLITNY